MVRSKTNQKAENGIMQAMARNIVLLIICLFLAGGAEGWAQPLRGEEARRWQSAWSAAQQGKHGEALDGFKSVLEKRADQNLYLQAGALLVRHGGQEQAEEIYLWGRRELKRPKAFADRLAELYQSQLRHDRAVAEWMKLLPERPDLVRSKLNEISQHIGHGRTADLAEKSASEAGDAGWLMVGGLQLSAGDDRQAWRAFSRIRDKGLMRQAVEQVAASGMPPSRKTTILEEYLSRGGTADKGLLARLGNHYLQDRQFQKASEAFGRIVPLDRPLGKVLSAGALLRQGDHAGALRAIGQGEAGEGWPDTLRWEARLLEAQARLMAGDGPAAAGLLSALAGDSAARPDYRQRAAFRLAELRFIAGQADSALAGYRRVASMGMGGEASNDALLRMILISEHKADKIKGLELFGRGLGGKAAVDYGLASSAFSRIAAEYPGTTLADQAMLELALMRQEQGQHLQAAGDWKRLAESASDPMLSCRASYMQGMVLKYDLGRAGEAAEVWRRAVVKNPDFSWSDLMRQELALMPEKKQ